MTASRRKRPLRLGPTAPRAGPSRSRDRSGPVGSALRASGQEWFLEVAMIGLPQSGKTTVFDAVTRGGAGPASHADGARPRLAVAKVPDDRLTRLSQIFGSKRAVPNEITYVDLPAAPGGPSIGAGVSGERLVHLQRADVLIIVVRAFENPSVPTPPGGNDPERDARTIIDELTLADLEILERRMARVEAGFKGAKTAERDALSGELKTIGAVRSDLEDGAAVREQALSAETSRMLAGFRLLTAKPVIVVANVGEEGLDRMAEMESRLEPALRVCAAHAAAMCGQLEMELAQMDPEDEAEFRASLGLREPGPNRMIALTRQALDLVTFFTANPNETRAWTAVRGTTAIQAASRIHTDIAKGFIRAETIGFEDLSRCGSVAEARKRGALRHEGRDYPVTEGDVVNILFNV